jgi:hypothetical protein
VEALSAEAGRLRSLADQARKRLASRLATRVGVRAVVRTEAAR